MDGEEFGSQQTQSPEEGIPEGGPIPLHRDTTNSERIPRIWRNTGGAGVRIAKLDSSIIKSSQGHTPARRSHIPAPPQRAANPASPSDAGLGG